MRSGGRMPRLVSRKPPFGEDVVADREVMASDTDSTPPPTYGAPSPVDVSAATFVWYSLLGVVLAGWFLFGWLVQNQGLVDSAGESLGTGFALLLAVSVVGTIRRSRR